MGLYGLFHSTGKADTGKKANSEAENQIAQLEREVLRLKETDLLTGVKNRCAFFQILKEIEKCNQRPGLLLVDIDDMKMINGRFGYEVGDQVLMEIAGLLSYCVPDHGIIGRLEGDIFAVLIPEADRDIMSEVGNRILFSVRELRANKMGIWEPDYKIRVSIGSVLWDNKAQLNYNMLLERAKAALKEAKKNGKDQQIEFSDNQALFLKMRADKKIRVEIERDMNHALAAKEFFPVFQPQYDIETGRIVGIEMLSRWLHPVKGLLRPSYYLSTLENNRFIIELDLYYFELACQILERWKKENRTLVPIACNFSGLHCHNPFWAEHLNQIAKKYNVSPSYLKIEIGEKSLMEEMDKMVKQMEKLREYGFLVSVQSFGAGFASIGILNHTPIDSLKIDRSITMNDFSQETNQMIFAGILSLAQVLQLHVYCIGIETPKQEEGIKKYGCRLAQGNYYCPPVGLEEMEKILSDNFKLLSKQRQKDELLMQGKYFLEDVLNCYFITGDIGRLEQMLTDQIQWKDIFETEKLNGKESVKAYHQKEIKGRVFELDFFSCNVFIEKDDVFSVNGEGGIREQERDGRITDRRFFCYAECIRQEDGLKLDQFRMVKIQGELVDQTKKLESIMRGSKIVRNDNSVLDAMYGRLPIGIIRFDLDMDLLITYINDAMLQILGYSREEFFYGEWKGNIRRLVYPKDLERLYTKSYEIAHADEKNGIEFRYIRKDGSLIRVCLYQHNVIGVSGRKETQVMCYPEEILEKGKVIAVDV